MATTHPYTLIVKQFPELIIPGRNVQPKLKSQAGFLINSVALSPSLYLYHDEVSIDDLME